MTVRIYTDGSAVDNGKPQCLGGWAFVVDSDPGNRLPMPFVKRESGIVPFSDSQPATSIRAEMLAAVKALEYISTWPEDQFNFSLYSDSAYLINCMTKKWYIKWMANGWRTSAGSGVANQDLWLRLVHINSIYKITWVKVKGHSGDPLNELCDHLAKSQVKLQQEKLMSGLSREEMLRCLTS